MQTISQKLYSRLLTTFSREDGQAMAEYGIILALIAVVVIGLVATLGGQIADAFTKVTEGLS